MLDRFTHLFRLRTIVDEGSLRKAADVLNVTQPALSRSIAILEAHYGKPLLVRHPRGVVATDFGARLISSVDRLARHWEQAENDLDESGQGNTGLLKMRSGPLWRTVLLPQVVTQLQIEYPNLTVEMESGAFKTTVPDLIEGRVDVVFGGIQIIDGPDRRLLRREFTRVYDRVIAREDHPLFQDLTDGLLTDPMRMLDYPWIVYSADPVYELVTIHGTIERLGQAPDIRIRSESLIATLAFLQRGDYLCVLPEAAVAGTTAPRLRPLPVEMGHRLIRSGALYRQEMADWPPLVRLLDLCQSLVN